MTEKNFGHLGATFQQTLLKAIIEDKKYGETIIEVIESKYFDNVSFRFISEHIKEYNKKYWPYQYFIDDKTYRISEVERWCWDQFKGRYWNNYGRNFVFKREKDAVMFALRWL